MMSPPSRQTWQVQKSTPLLGVGSGGLLYLVIALAVGFGLCVLLLAVFFR